VALTGTDPNGNKTTAAYADTNFWRVTTVTDPWGNATTQSYPSPTSNTSESKMTFNGGQSTNDVLTTYDALGRVSLVQQLQAPASTTYDTMATTFDLRGRLYQASIPYSGAAGAFDVSKATVALYDAWDRPTSVTDAGGGYMNYSYPQNDVLVSQGPAATIPATENTKRRQIEYDALGRVASACEVTSGTVSAPAGSCSQKTAATGYLTQYSYDAAGRQLTVKQNVQAGPSATQTRQLVYDNIGRVLQEVIPETGTTYYTYDSDTTGVCTGSYIGDLIKKVDAVGNVTCIAYDALHRALSAKVVSGPYMSVTPQLHFVYDAATLSGTTMQNVKGSLAEAYTCTGSCTSKITDVFFSYSPEMAGGQPTGKLIGQMWELTPHSGAYYLTQDTYYPNGTISNLYASLNGASIGIPHMSYGLDGEGRLKTATDTDHSLNLATGTTYNSAGLSTLISYGNSDSDSYSYDANTNRPGGYTFSVTGSAAFTVTGALTWNQGGTLRNLIVTDSADSSKNQNCTYGADDLNRIASVNCAAAWGQTFTYDAFGNIKKTGTSSYLPSGYNPLTNRVSGGVPATYDANGNMLTDNSFTFTWSALNLPATINSTSGATYDALARPVELANGTTYTQFVYRPSGDKIATVNGATLVKGTIPLPGGAGAIYNSGGFTYLRHKDWLGSSRLATKWDHSLYSNESYAPFGEAYDEAGTPDRSFTGQDQDTTSGLYDFLFRRYNASSGRWISPDPAGWSAVSQAYPQSLDRYAYVKNNPLSLIDPLGLDCAYLSEDGTSVLYTTAGDCQPGDGGFYFDGTVDQNSLWVDDNGDVHNSADGACSGECPGSDFVFIVDVNAKALVGRVTNFLKYNWFSLSVFVPDVPILVGGVPVAAVGHQYSVAWNFSTHSVCAGLSVGVGFPFGGKSFQVGPLNVGNVAATKSIIQGWSVSTGIQPLPGLGGQMQTSSPGSVGGLAVGTPGVAATGGYSVCN
jgi:RHS repeat-associated protein